MFSGPFGALTRDQAHRREAGRVNFDRAAIFGAGVGHHSPIGGYLADQDLVLVLDTNEKFRPWLVSRERLLMAMNTMDGGSKRGIIVIER